MHEDLFGEDEPRDVRPAHPMVSHVPVPPVSGDALKDLPVHGSVQEIVEALAELCRAPSERVASTGDLQA